MKRPRAKVRPITIEEFRAWLEGVEEMQSDDWTPSKEQWNKIRAKIQQVESSVQVQKRLVDLIETKPIGPTTVRAFTNDNPVRNTQGTTLTVPQVPSSIPVPTGPIRTPETQTPNGSIIAPDGKVKTPDIDTADGEYTSQFV